MSNIPRYGFNLFPISPNTWAVSYNFFNQPTEIAEGEIRLEISYAANPNLQNWVQEIENARGRQCRQAVQTRWCGGIAVVNDKWLMING